MSFHTNFHQYTRDYRSSWLFPIAARWLRYFHNRTLRTFAPTRELCDSLAADGYRNLRVLSRGVDTGLFSPGRHSLALRAAWGVGPDDPVIIHAGRMAREKNYGLLFRAFDAMRRVNPRCRLVLVGDGPLRPVLQAEHPHCFFTGFIDRDALARHYASGDIYLHASVTETYGNVIAEALASGLACSGYNYAAAHELIQHGASGLLAPLADESVFIAAAQRLATDVPLRSRLRARAAEAVRHRSWHDVLNRFEADLLEVTGSLKTSMRAQALGRRSLPPSSIL